jgi:DNA-3-methyladenine glycosylase II
MATNNPIQHLSSNDKNLGLIIDSIPLPEYKNTHDIFEDLVSCILDMRIHYAGSTAAFRYKLIKHLIDNEPITPETIWNLTPYLISKLKLSRQKDESLKILATKWHDENMDQINWKLLSAEEVFNRLNGIKGIGKWTVQMVLLFTMERPDIFPVKDYQLRKSMCEVYGLSDDNRLSERMQTISKKWSPHRSLAVRYLWKWREVGKNRR